MTVIPFDRQPARPSFEQIVSANVDKTTPELLSATWAVYPRPTISEISTRLRALAAAQTVKQRRVLRRLIDKVRP